MPELRSLIEIAPALCLLRLNAVGPYPYVPWFHHRRYSDLRPGCQLHWAGECFTALRRVAVRVPM